jgi:large subunit ribosomal protein L2
MTSQDTSPITTKKPLRSLIVSKKRGSGRNNQGRITTRHKGGGARRFYRLVNFNLPTGTKAVVEQIEYDPNRTAHIARIKDQNNVYHYVLAPNGVGVGTKIESGDDAPIEAGNRLPIKNIPIGSTIHAVELQPGKGAQIARAAGIRAQLSAKEGDYAQVRMPSGEVRLVHINCMATLGSVGNEQHQNIKIGKAGRNRHLGKRPTVRGIVMNAVDHPHGGGDGGAHGIGRNPRSPWGQPTLGFKTRSRKITTKFIVKSRHAAKRK